MKKINRLLEKRDFRAINALLEERGLPPINGVAAFGDRSPREGGRPRTVYEVRHGRYSTTSWGRLSLFDRLGPDVVWVDPQTGEERPGAIVAEYYHPGDAAWPATYSAGVAPAEYAEAVAKVIEEYISERDRAREEVV